MRCKQKKSFFFFDFCTTFVYFLIVFFDFLLLFFFISSAGPPPPPNSLDPPPRDRPIIRSCFPSPALRFRSFSLSGSFRGIRVVFLKRWDPQIFMFGVLGLQETGPFFTARIRWEQCGSSSKASTGASAFPHLWRKRSTGALSSKHAPVLGWIPLSRRVRQAGRPLH